MKQASDQPRAAVGYIRVSTTRQAENGVSLETQRTKIKQWCALHEYKLVGIFEDLACSGARQEDRLLGSRSCEHLRKPGQHHTRRPVDVPYLCVTRAV